MSPIDNSNIQTNTAPKKRGRKSKKEMSQLLESDSDLAVAMALGVIVNRKK